MVVIGSTAALGALLRETRKAQDVSQEQLAAVSGVGVRFVRELEQGKPTCQIEKAWHIMAALGLRVYVAPRSERVL